MPTNWKLSDAEREEVRKFLDAIKDFYPTIKEIFSISERLERGDITRAEADMLTAEVIEAKRRQVQQEKEASNASA